MERIYTEEAMAAMEHERDYYSKQNCSLFHFFILSLFLCSFSYSSLLIDICGCLFVVLNSRSQSFNYRQLVSADTKTV